MTKTEKWLLQGDPWVRYKTHLELIGNRKKDAIVKAESDAVLQDQRIKTIINELMQWPGSVLKRHNDAKHLVHKLTFLADLDLDIYLSGLDLISEKILAQQSEEGPFQVLINIPTVFGGSGKDEYSWMLCDAPLVVYALSKMGFHDHPEVLRAFRYLINLLRENGWPCAATNKFGKKFKGPGRREDPCPYANLVMLKMLSAFPEFIDSNEADTGIETLLNLWKKRKQTKPFLFAMGTDFKKLKAPFIWYDILHVLTVLSAFPQTKGRDEVLEMLEILRSKRNEEGRYYAESVYRAWKDFDFGQKKVPSQWITLIIYLVFKAYKQK